MPLSFSKVLYRIQYSNTSTNIVSVMAEFVLGSVTADGGLDLKQKVSVSFSKVKCMQIGVTSHCKFLAGSCDTLATTCIWACTCDDLVILA